MCDLPMSPGTRGHHPSRRRTSRHTADIHHGPLNFSAAYHGSMIPQTRPRPRHDGLTVDVDFACLKADTTCPGWMEYDRQVRKDRIPEGRSRAA